jgi:hypothetical protein
VCYVKTAKRSKLRDVLLVQIDFYFGKLSIGCNSRVILLGAVNMTPCNIQYEAA